MVYRAMLHSMFVASEEATAGSVIQKQELLFRQEEREQSRESIGRKR